MPAARRYKQTLVDEIKEAIRGLPPGLPPEPELTTREAIEALKDDIRRKVFDEHVDVATIVELLNARGFKVKPADLRPVTSRKSNRTRPAAAPARNKGAAKRASNGAETGSLAKPPSHGSGTFPVRPDEDDT